MNISSLYELSHRAREMPLTCPDADAGLHMNSLHTFNEITKHYQLGRSVYPLLHAKLSKPQSSTFHMLQTGSYHSLARVSSYADSFKPDCPERGDPFCTLEHMLWAMSFITGRQSSHHRRVGEGV